VLIVDHKGAMKRFSGQVVRHFEEIVTATLLL